MKNISRLPVAVAGIAIVVGYASLNLVNWMTVIVATDIAAAVAVVVGSIAFDFLLNKMNFVASNFALNWNFGHVDTCD